MRTNDARIRRSGVAEEEHVLRLWALLHELVRGNGRVGAAGILGLDPRTVAACMDAGRMSWRVREALERAQREGLGSGAASTRSGVQSLNSRVETLERGVRDIADEVRSEVRPLVMDHARMLRQLEGGPSATGDPRPEVKDMTDVTPRRESCSRRVRGLPYSGKGPGTIEQRRYPDLVARDPAPDDAEVYGPAWPLVDEWRRLWEVHHGSRRWGLSGLTREERIRELEVAMLEEYGLTLPPETEPLRGLWRSSQLDWRKRALRDLRRSRARRVALLWMRRILTLGLWRK